MSTDKEIDGLKAIPVVCENKTFDGVNRPTSQFCTWQPIETAPKRKFILVIADETYPVCAINWTGEQNIWNFDTWIMNSDDNSPLWFEPTHWMPLPKLPEGK